MALHKIEYTISRTIGSLFLVCLLNPHLPISTEEVESGKPVGSSQCVEGGINVWQWISNLVGDFIGSSIVDAETG